MSITDTLPPSSVTWMPPICGGASPGIEPIAANVYNHKTLSGSYIVRNPYLRKVLAKYGRDDEETWNSITVRKGSVQQCKGNSNRKADKIYQPYIRRFIADMGVLPYDCLV